MPVNVAAVVIFTGFALLNLLGVHQTARFELAVTIVAVAELLVFMALVGPSFSWERFATGGFEHGLPGVFAAIPYAIWFFLAIEGVAMTAEEVRNPARDIPIGAVFMYIVCMLALFVLRRREPTLPRPFRVPGYPVVPAMALVLLAVSLVAMVWFNPVIAAVFAGLLAAAAAAFAVAGPAAEDAA